MMAICLPNGAKLTIDQEYEQMTPLSRPDPQWRFTDGHGHIHQWDFSSGWVSATVPTIRFVWDREPGPDVEEDGGEGHYECLLCRDLIEDWPRSVANCERVFIPTLRHIYVEDWPVALSDVQSWVDAPSIRYNDEVFPVLCRSIVISPFEVACCNFSPLEPEKFLTALRRRHEPG